MFVAGRSSAAQEGKHVAARNRGSALAALALDQTHERTHVTLLMKQVGEADSFQNVVDLLLQQLPHRPNAASLRRRAPLFLDRMRNTVEVESRHLGRSDHGANRDVGGFPGESVAPMSTARASHDLRASKTQEDLLDVV